MFFKKQTENERIKYEKFLKITGALSGLFSDSEVPYLNYRVAERIFCTAFSAQDLSRADVSADAKKDGVGIGLKTFLAGNHKSLQKVAEFNSANSLYNKLTPRRLVKKISELRNNRIDFTEKVYALNTSIYHCVVREAGKFKIFEEPMERVDINNISNIEVKKNIITFNDGKNDYSFSQTKSTLLKRFITPDIVFEFDIQILEDPFAELSKFIESGKFMIQDDVSAIDTIFLPLYGRNKKVFSKSGLNQWNASGRMRNPNEVYINIPAKVRFLFPDFFPSRDIVFNLKFPDGEIIEASVCQDGGKALMTNPNRKLGKLILRDGLKLKHGEIVTYEKLQFLGVDSVRIDKINNFDFEINFAKNNSYEDFITSFN
ncbi:MAG: NgoFVII family restriction endonuclease [Candidatus Pacebacteria bacterium]|nr:NgoFVII family restriction endonuclease [Candidatus Paceibacterota bacterium]